MNEDITNMEKIMKKSLGLVVILAAVVLGSYYATGLVTEHTLNKNINMVNLTTGLKVETEDYHRGWFTSTANYNLSIPIPARIIKNDAGQTVVIPAETHTIAMPLTIYHGPIIFVDSSVRFGLGYASTTLNLPQSYADKFANSFTAESIRPQINVNLLVNYLNKSHLQINIPAFKLFEKNGKGQYEWQGMTNDITITPEMYSSKGNLTLNGMSFVKENLNAVLSKLTSEYDLHKTPEGLFLGSANLSLPSFIAKQGTEVMLEVSNFVAHSKSDVHAGLFDSYLDSSIDKLITNNKTYGPGFLKVSLKNLDAQVLARINQQANTLQQDPNQDRQKTLLALLPELPKLVSKGATFEISEVSFVMPEGKVEGNLFIALPNGELGNPFQLIQKIAGHGKLKVPAIVLQTVFKASALQQLLQQPVALDEAKDAQVPNQPLTNSAPPVNSAPATTTTPPTTSSDATSVQIVIPAPAPLTATEIEQKATTQAEQKLAALVQAGLLTLDSNSAYAVEFKLADGQFYVNGQPFNPAMMKF